MNMLVGYTGFVGSNLVTQFKFDELYNSKNITDAFGKNPDMLVYAGVPAQKFYANKYPERDHETILNAINNIKMIKPKNLVLISTIDVYKNVVGVDEKTAINIEGLHAYGLNRYILEKWVEENIGLFEQVAVIRLPGLFGKGIKKNMIYDMINVIPAMLNTNKYEELSSRSSLVKKFFIDQNNGFFKCECKDCWQREILKQELRTLKFTALDFTDSRAQFQFYNLDKLWTDIQIIIRNKISLVNLATEPVVAKEIYQSIMKKSWTNLLDGPVPKYDFRTIYYKYFQGADGYISTKEDVTSSIIKFVEKAR